MSAIRALLWDLIDYAGLFPPAELGMMSAVRNYNDYRNGEYSWALGRFVVPAARLDEFGSFACGTPMRLTVLGMPQGSIPNVETLELKATQVSEIEAAAGGLPAN